MRIRFDKFLLFVIAVSILLVAVWANVESFAIFEYRIHSDINSGSRTIETIVGRDTDINIGEIWHLLNFMKRREVQYFELLDSKNEVLLQNGNIDISRKERVNIPLLNRGKRFGSLNYVLDRDEELRVFFSQNWLYVILTVTFALILGVMAPFFIVYNERKFKKALDYLATIESPESAGNIVSQARDNTLKLLAKRIKSILEKFEQQRSELEKVHLEKAKFEAISTTTQTIAHDLKSPINVINQTLNSNNWLEFLQRKPVTTSAMLRLQGMVDSFKNADLEGVVKNNWGTISWDGIVNEMRSLAAEKGVLLHLEDVYRGSVYLDIPKMERVVINLLKNAIEAGSKNIWLSGRANGMDLAIKVSDDGSGVPEEFVPYLFTKGKTLNKVDGTGLGLSFVRQTANGHGGEATYERIDNRSIFGITLPKVVKDEKDEKDAAEGEQGMFKIELKQLGGEPVKDEETFIGVQKKEIFSKVTVKLGNEQLELKVIEALAKQYPTVKFGDSLEGSSFVWTSDHELIKDAITKKIPIHMLSDKETPEALVKTISNKLQYFT